jgi:cytoskeletal protein RodZ
VNPSVTLAESILLGIIFLVIIGFIWWWYEGLQESRIETLEDEVFKLKKEENEDEANSNHSSTE